MKTFFALVEADPDSAYGVSFPDLPGCFSAADRLEDVLPNAAEALELWFEDVEPVTPRSLEKLRGEVADRLANGAFLLAVPHISRSTRQRRVNISVDTGTLDAIDTAAAGQGLTRSAFLAMAALNEIRGTH